MHERLGGLCIASFNQLQSQLVASRARSRARTFENWRSELILLCEEQSTRYSASCSCRRHSNYNFTKPLYVAASLVELIRRYNDYSATPIDDGKKLQMIIAALGFNLGLLAYEKQVYESHEEFSPEEKRELREHYPQQSADMLKAAGLDQAVMQDVVRNHNVASDNPSQRRD